MLWHRFLLGSKLAEEVKLAKHATQSSDTLSFGAMKGGTPRLYGVQLALRGIIATVKAYYA